jgi:hypothetical protein
VNEKIYKTMTSSAIFNLVIGIVSLVTGIVTGVLLILTAARLLKNKSDIMI